MSIKFQEHSETGYALRTLENARLADLTIAFALDFDTPGEKLTRKAAYGKYHCVSLAYLYMTMDMLLGISEKMEERKVKCLNVAGNGLYTLNKYTTQQKLDDYFYDSLGMLTEVYNSSFSIRSGGQTGVDEAALKAGDRLGLETTCLAPKHWLFRNAQGVDIMDERLFLGRFGSNYDVNDLL